MIDFYIKKLSQGRGEVEHQIENLQKGLLTLAETQSKVKGIEEQLKVVMVEVEKQTKETQDLIQIVNT